MTETLAHRIAAYVGAAFIAIGLVVFLVSGLGVAQLVLIGAGVQPVCIWAIRKYDGWVDVYLPFVQYVGGGLGGIALIYALGGVGC